MPTETGRHRLYEKIKEQWGEEHAAELMSYLPPVGWADVATKHDLAALAAKLDARFEAMDGKFGTMDGKFGTMDGKFGTMGARFETLEARFDSKIDRLRSDLHDEMANQLRWVLGSTISAMAVLTALFAVIVGLMS
jgi:hypothetical protein